MIYLNQMKTIFGDQDQRSPAIESVIADFHRRWARLLAITPGQRRLRYSCEELRDPVQEMFAAPAPGWSMAGQHSPDIMIVASSAEAIQRGDYELVMGEVHVGVNTLRGSCFVAQHPDPDELAKWYMNDMSQTQLARVSRQ